MREVEEKERLQRQGKVKGKEGSKERKRDVVPLLFTCSSLFSLSILMQLGFCKDGGHVITFSPKVIACCSTFRGLVIKCPLVLPFFSVPLDPQDGCRWKC